VSVPYSQEITTDVIGQFNSEETRPVNANKPLIEDPVLYVNETSAAWGSVSQSETPIDMAFTVYNPKTVSYTITEIGYEITMNDIGVGEGTTSDPYVIEGESETTIEAATAIRNQRLDEWWVSHLERNQVTDLRIDFYARVELPVGETIRIPLDELAYEKRIETDFFGTKPETGTESESPSSNETPTDGTETSALDGDVEPTDIPDDVVRSPGTVTNGNETVLPGVGSDNTATPTEERSERTATPTDNSTDDGGLL
jgi:LEA14-like dessication related protein